MTASSESALIDKATVARLLGVSLKTIQRMGDTDPTFPRRINPTGCKTLLRYSRAAVEAWIARQAAPADA